MSLAHMSGCIHRPTYRDVRFEGFEPYLAKRYADSRPVGWDVLIEEHEESDAMEAFYRLLREYVAQAEEILILPRAASVKLDDLIDRLEDNLVSYLGERDMEWMRSFINGYAVLTTVVVVGTHLDYAHLLMI